MTHAPLWLASASPRRHALLQQIGVSFRVRVPAIDETHQPPESPEFYVERVARAKAAAVRASAPDGDAAPVLAADTAVVIAGALLGKPRDPDDAARMLRLLSGRAHEVYSAVVLLAAGGERSRLSRSRVWFRDLEARDIEAYCRSGEPDGKAGAYAIQGLGALFVARLEGSYSGVMGLPLYETGELLRELGHGPFAPAMPGLEP